MTDKDRLQKQLNRPPVPSDLQQKIRANWQAQQRHERHSGNWRRLAGVAAGILLVAVTFGLLQQTPSVVEAAAQDLLADARHDIGLSVPVDDIAHTHHINFQSAESRIRMTKTCNLDEYSTVHLQIADADQGEIHLFIYAGELNKHFWQLPRGEIGDMPWRLINPRNDLSVLVLHAPGADPDQVDRMIRNLVMG